MVDGQLLVLGEWIKERLQLGEGEVMSDWQMQ